MSDDQAALIRAVCEAPDDDAPRLVYADWLDEHGRPERAEFIRLQCARARKIGTPAERTRWLRRSLALFREFGNQFAAEDWPDLTQTVTATTFDRGFVEELRPTGLQLRRDRLRELINRPLMALVRRLGLEFNEVGDDGMEVIAACPYASRLSRLDIAGNQVTDEGLQALAASPHLRSLADLGIEMVGLFPATAHPGEFDMAQLLAEFERQWAEREARLAAVQEMFRQYGKMIRVRG